MNGVPKRQTQFLPHSFGLVRKSSIRSREMRSQLQAWQQLSRDVCVFNSTINLRELDYDFQEMVFLCNNLASRGRVTSL